MEQEKEYITTKEQCQKQIDESGCVCSSCGGIIEPIETVDNADRPTYWSHCSYCEVFMYGVQPEVYKIAEELVKVQERSVTSQKSKWGLEGWELKDWYRYELSSMSSIVQQVLQLYKIENGTKKK